MKRGLKQVSGDHVESGGEENSATQQFYYFSTPITQFLIFWKLTIFWKLDIMRIERYYEDRYIIKILEKLIMRIARYYDILETIKILETIYFKDNQIL